MSFIFHPLLALIASATDRQLAQYIQFLKEENKILRARLPQQVHTRRDERERLLKFGKVLGRAIEELITIVSPATFYRWLKEESGTPKRKTNPKGGQRKPQEIRELVLQIASLTNFGLTRIVGELRKMGIKKISRQTVRNILKEEGIRPVPDRTSDTWQNFVDRHAKTLWATDFFSVKTVTPRGLKEMYVMVWLCMTTREAIVSESTEHPNSAWVVKQTESNLKKSFGWWVEFSVRVGSGCRVISGWLNADFQGLGGADARRVLAPEPEKQGKKQPPQQFAEVAPSGGQHSVDRITLQSSQEAAAHSMILFEVSDLRFDGTATLAAFFDRSGQVPR